MRCVNVVLLVGAALLAAVPISAVAQEPRADERIAAGIAASGVDLSGLTTAEAAAKLGETITPKVTTDIVVQAGAKEYRLTAADAKLRFDADQTARRALYAGRARPAAAPTASGGGAVAGTDVGLAISYSRVAVAAFVRQTQTRSARAPRNATLKITVRKMVVRRARIGRQLAADALAAAIGVAIISPSAQRTLRAKLLKVYPKTNRNDLAKQFSTVLTADRSTFKLRIFKNLKLRKTYGIAVGQAGYGTPGGRFSIVNKQVDPTWHVPNSDWAGSLAGTTVPGGAPNNPLKARWLGITDGVGIHGTGEPWSIGSRASHGCLRMKVPDVIDLYPRVPVGTTILIK